MSNEGSSPQPAPDWEKAHEVALAILHLCERHRSDPARVRPWIPFLDTIEEEGWIEDAEPALGWVQLTDAGRARAREMLRRHFGIVVGDDPRTDEASQA